MHRRFILFASLPSICAAMLGIAQSTALASGPTLSATEQSQLDAIAKDVFEGQAMPADMLAMCSQQLRRGGDNKLGRKNSLRYDAWQDMAAVCLTPATRHEPRDMSYLNETERKDPDIAANTQATLEVMRHITFVVKTDNSDFLGYWQWPAKGIANARIVRYDTEGQFTLEAGRTITEALLLEHISPDDGKRAEAKYKRAKASLDKLGAGTLPASFQALNQLTLPRASVHPNDMHEQLYKRYRAQAPSK